MPTAADCCVRAVREPIPCVINWTIIDESPRGRDRDSSAYARELQSKQCVRDDGQRCLFSFGASRTGASRLDTGARRRCHRRCHPGCHRPRRRRPCERKNLPPDKNAHRRRTGLGPRQERDRSDPHAVSPNRLDHARACGGRSCLGPNVITNGRAKASVGARRSAYVIARSPSAISKGPARRRLGPVQAEWER